MISVIVCSRLPREEDTHRRNVARTIGTAYEYLRVDNSAGRSGICGAYNQAVAAARGEILLFVHEDVFCLKTGWGEVLESKFAADPRIGLVGVAGTQRLPPEQLAWWQTGQPLMRGRVVHESQGRQWMTVYSHDTRDAEVVVADGLFLAVRAAMFQQVRWDQAIFDHFHFYDLDICMQIRRTHRNVVTCNIPLKHITRMTMSDQWSVYAGRFLRKYAAELPASCYPGPLPPRTVPFETLQVPQYLPTIA